MAIVQNALVLLQEIYNLHYKSRIVYSLSRDQIDKLTSFRKKELAQNIDYLEGLGYIKKYHPTTGIPIRYKITSLGINKIESVLESDSVSSTNITINGNVSGIIGHNVKGNTINQGYSIDDLQKLISETVPNMQERQAIQESLEPLFKRIELNAPLEKGLLSSAKEHLEKYQSLYGSVLQVIGPFLFNK